MALLRLILSPSTTHFPAERQTHFITPFCSLQNPPKNTQSHLSVSCSLPCAFPLSHSHNTRCWRPVKSRKDENLVSHFSSTAQEQALEPPPVNESRESGSETEEILKNRLYAQNMPWNFTPEDIGALFEKYGTVEDVELSMYNKIRNRGLAFVTMGSPEEAHAALNNLQS